jgi:hypothetical protein
LLRKALVRNDVVCSAEDKCRHYMIDIRPSGKYIVVGESKVHTNLSELVDYYRKVIFCCGISSADYTMILANKPTIKRSYCNVCNNPYNLFAEQTV